ncbi:hypothetical protein XF36_19170 [Pseudonocardia sp. HH130629-09]|nr:hypothetical protein XF36_19170 [Pseudonocardia sp. HH130629-09]
MSGCCGTERGRPGPGGGPSGDATVGRDDGCARPRGRCPPVGPVAGTGPAVEPVPTGGVVLPPEGVVRPVNTGIAVVAGGAVSPVALPVRSGRLGGATCGVTRRARVSGSAAPPAPSCGPGDPAVGGHDLRLVDTDAVERGQLRPRRGRRGRSGLLRGLRGGIARRPDLRVVRLQRLVPLSRCPGGPLLGGVAGLPGRCTGDGRPEHPDGGERGQSHDQ